MSNVDKGQTRREDEYSQTRMVEKSTKGGGGRGIPNEGDDIPNADGAGGNKKIVRCMTHVGDDDGHALTVFTCNTKNIKDV